MITAKTRLNMVIGYPLTHTQSPLLHNLIYQALDIDAVLLAFAQTNIKAIIEAIKTLSVGLTAVTMPFKEKILEFIEPENHSTEVASLKAANTIIQRDQKLYAYNTDVAGISYAFRHTSLRNKRVLILGAGGAARAAAYVLSNNQAKLLWWNRTPEKADALIKVFGGEFIGSDKFQDSAVDIIINTTPLGMNPNIEYSPLPHYSFNHQQIVFDMIYNPIETVLLKTAKKCGATTINGLEMFLGQGIRQVELWSNKVPPEEKNIDLLNQLRQHQ